MDEVFFVAERPRSGSSGVNIQQSLHTYTPLLRPATVELAQDDEIQLYDRDLIRVYGHEPGVGQKSDVLRYGSAFRGQVFQLGLGYILGG